MYEPSLQLVPANNPQRMRPAQKAAVAAVSVGLLLFTAVAFGAGYTVGWIGLALTLAGALLYAFDIRNDGPAGIKNNYIMFGSSTRRGLIGWFLGIYLTGFYVLIYFFPEYLRDLIAMVDPIKVWLVGESDIAADGSVKSQWFFYGVLYTLAILVMGVRAIVKYRHSKYQMLRTCSVMFFQLGFAFLLPNILYGLNQPYYEWTNIWPLRYYELFPSSVNSLLQDGALGKFMVFWGVISILIVTPVLTYFYGKRWYCSWVCGCGGLAETLGDPWRQNSDKSLSAWQVERWLIHSVLVFIILTTGLLWAGYAGWGGMTRVTFVFGVIAIGFWVIAKKSMGLANRETAVTLVFPVLAAGVLWATRGPWLKTWLLTLIAIAGAGLFWLLAQRLLAFTVKQRAVISGLWVLNAVALFLRDPLVNFTAPGNLSSWYGFLIGAVFSGVIGVGFYPIMGTRVWCRFGCPMAAILGIGQRYFSRFRITTNGGQCISCGNCSTYCEMGIDVRAYAQRGDNIVRASCVGCGVCSSVCPRGVLNLENGPQEGRLPV